MVQQYIRQATLIVGTTTGKGLDFSELQFKFQVNRGDIQTPNTLLVRVYNVSENTINLLQDPKIEFKPVLLQAGYEGNFGTIFNGFFKYVFRGHESAIDSYIDILAGDGDSAYNFAVVNKTLAAGSKASDQIAAAAQAMAPYGVTQGALPSSLSQNSLPRGKVMFGMARKQLRKIANTNNCTWGIDDNTIQLIPQNAYLPTDIVLLTSATGMIGFPEQTQNGIIITTLLNPNIKIGTRVQIDNKSVQQFHFDLSIQGQAAASLVPSLSDDGVYKVLYAEHFGDTRGNSFYTKLTCITVNPTAPMSPNLINKTGSVQPYGPS